MISEAAILYDAKGYYFSNSVSIAGDLSVDGTIINKKNETIATGIRNGEIVLVNGSVVHDVWKRSASAHTESVSLTNMLLQGTEVSSGSVRLVPNNGWRMQSLAEFPLTANRDRKIFYYSGRICAFGVNTNDSLYCYSLSTKQWFIASNDVPVEIRYVPYMRAVYYAGSVYLVGQNMLFRYNNGFTRIMPSSGAVPKAVATAVVYGQYMYVWGDSTYEDVGTSVFIYDFVSNAWSVVSPASRPSGRGYSCSVIIGSYWYILGGYILSTSSGTNELWRMDLTTNVFTLVSNSGPGSNGMPMYAVVIDSSMVVFATDGSVYAYHPVNSTWTYVSISGATAPSRSFHTAVVVGNDIFVFGGQLSQGTSYALNDLYIVLKSSYPTFSASSAISTETILVSGGARLVPDFVCSMPAGTDIRYSVSFDQKSTWLVWDSTDGWTTMTSDPMYMSTLTTALSSLPNVITTMNLRVHMNTADLQVTPTISKISFSYQNSTLYEQLTRGIDYKVIRSPFSQQVALVNLTPDVSDLLITFN